MAREMKDSGIEWIGEIPADWDVVKVKNVFSKHKDIVGDNVEKYERLALTLNGVIKRSKEDREGLQPTDFKDYQILREGDLVFKLIDLENTQTSRVGYSPYEGLVSPAYICLSCKNKEIDPKFAEKYFMSLWNRNIFNSMGDCGVRSSLNANDLLNIPIVLPDIGLQHRIASFLDSKCAEIDKAVEATKASIEEYKKLRQAIITETVTKGLDPNVEMKDSGIEWIGEIPKEWLLNKGKYIFVQRNDKGNTICLQLLSPTQKYGVIPQVKYEELSGMKAVKLNEKVNLAELKTVHAGAYCISLRSFQGGFEYSNYEGVVSPAYQIFYPRGKINDYYYKYLFKTEGFIQKMNSFTMSLRDGKNIAFEDFGNTLLPVPPLSEQNYIADFINSKCAEIDSLIKSKEKLIEELTAYRKSLIYEYVTGKKEVPIESA